MLILRLILIVLLAQGLVGVIFPVKFANFVSNFWCQDKEIDADHPRAFYYRMLGIIAIIFSVVKLLSTFTS